MTTFTRDDLIAEIEGVKAELAEIDRARLRDYDELDRLNELTQYENELVIQFRAIIN